MIYRGKAPLRIGLAGGGTDVSPYSELFGGAVLNATITLSAHAAVELLDKPVVQLIAKDGGQTLEYQTGRSLPIDGNLDLLKAVYNRYWKDHGISTLGLRLTTSVDAPAGSGLGTSSTLVVALVGVFNQLAGVEMTAREIARYAFDIERGDLGWAGGKQDQYAAALGGFNFMEFINGSVDVTPLDIPAQIWRELEDSMLLYYTGSFRDGATIIRQQASNVINNETSSITAMHNLKQQAYTMKDALLAGDLKKFGELLDLGFENKRLMASGISNPLIEDMYNAAKAAGAIGGKISGAGGGGFLVFYCPGSSRIKVETAMQAFPGYVKPFQFTGQGLKCWEEPSLEKTLRTN